MRQCGDNCTYQGIIGETSAQVHIGLRCQINVTQHLDDDDDDDDVTKTGIQLLQSTMADFNI